MSKPKLFADAVAEAKEIRETAFSNAKLAMAESFAPQIKSMLSSQLNEMEEESEVSLDELLNELEGQETELDEIGGGSIDPANAAAAGLDNLIAQIKSAAAKTPGILQRIKKELEAGGAAAGAALRSEGLELDEEAEGEDVVGEITVDELKDIIRQVQQELSEEEPENEFEEEGEVEFEPESEEGSEEDEDINLDEVLSEMGGNSIDPANAAAAGLDNIISMIKKAGPAVLAKIKAELAAGGAAAGSAMRSEATELQEAKKVIADQSKLLKEMNLLNSKLLYVNKIFKAKNLTESQKVKVVNALDRGKTVKETQNIFLTLKESLITTPTTQLRENRGSASRPAGSSPRALNEQVTTQESDFVLRMQQLAGIVK